MIDEIEQCVDIIVVIQPRKYRRVLCEPYRLQPTAMLSTLSRVCSTFSATIQGSPKLRRLFVGDHSTSLHDSPPSLALKWLLEHALGMRRRREEQLNVLQFANQFRQTRLQLQHFSKQRGKYAEASWRQVKIRQEAGSFPLKMWVEFRRPNGYKGTSVYYDAIETGNGATLGNFLDDLALILHRSGSENVAKVQAFLKQRRW